MTVFPPCATCARFYRDDRDEERCEAFPDGIPQPILDAKNNHRQPYPGDNGKLYKPVRGYDA